MDKTWSFWKLLKKAIAYSNHLYRVKTIFYLRNARLSQKMKYEALITEINVKEYVLTINTVIIPNFADETAYKTMH